MDSRLGVLQLIIALISLQYRMSVLGDVTEDTCINVSCKLHISTIKEEFAAQINANLTGCKPSKYIENNQCWDCPLVNQVYQTLSSRRRKRQSYNFTADPRRQWSLPISYLFDSSIPSANSIGFDAKVVIRNVLSYIQAQTCIRFTEADQPFSTSFISFRLGSSCVSFVGKTLDSVSCPISATTSCLTQFGEMLYLVVQTLGVWHESQRYDRDNYITVLTNNVVQSNQGDLGILDPSWNLLVTYGLAYDYASLMQFSSKVFSKNGNYTIVTRDPLYLRTLGQRVQLSFQDTKLLNLMYCTAACSSQPLSSPCQNGGYQNPNDCSKCHCPDGFSGTLCADLEPPQGAICGGQLTATYIEQTVTSPGYYSPGYYDSQVRCSWRISALTGSRIRLRFYGEFGIYCRDESCYHWVEVRYTGQMNETGPRICCSDLLSQELLSSSNQVLLILQSNLTGIDTSSRRGFQLAYSLLSTSTATLPTVTTPFMSGPCNPNPCHNNGICVANTTSTTGFTCKCPTGLLKPLCQQGCCGGCNMKPGRQQLPCVMNENPLRMCNTTAVGSRSSSSSSRWHPRGWFIRHRRHMPRYQVIQVPCTIQFCCDNAQLIGDPNIQATCSVSGWTDWSSCNALCGGGQQTKYFYSIREQFTVTGQAYNISVMTNMTSVTCNVDTCQCPSYWWSRWWSRWCSPCNYGFTQQGTTCQPN